MKKFNPDDRRFNPPNFDENILQHCLYENYGITGHFKTLAGERDQNVSVTTQQGQQYIFKISSFDELNESIDLQIQALLYLEKMTLNYPYHVKLETSLVSPIAR